LRSAVSIALLAGSLLAGAASGQTPSRVIGEVTGLEPGSNQIRLKTDQGAEVTVTVAAGAAIRKVPPGVQDLKSATRIEFSGIGTGDRVLAIGQASGDGAKVEARSVIVMSRADLTQKQQAEHEDWRKRGVAGTVTAIDPGGTAFTIKSGAATLGIVSGPKTGFHRYAPDSIRFSDARPSSFSEIRTGDSVRVLGTKSADGRTVAAERIVSGSFRQVAATVTSVDAEKTELTIKDLATKKSMVVRIRPKSILHGLPPAMAAALARRYRSAEPSSDGEDPGALPARLPAIPFSDLKPGDAVMLSIAGGTGEERATAIMLLAGVEPLLTASPGATRDMMSGWNLAVAE
jgi:hypothetical protein